MQSLFLKSKWEIEQQSKFIKLSTSDSKIILAGSIASELSFQGVLCYS